MSKLDLKKYLDEKQEIIDSTLKKLLPNNIKLPPIISESMIYSVNAGGKRLRPILTMAAAEAIGGDSSDVVITGCAIELIHTYSLIHDDLPCMDNANLRRGVPTNHKVFGEAMAVLAGDAMLTLAFEVLASNTFGSAEKNLEVIKLIAKAAGPLGMGGGQAADLMWEGEKLSLDRLEWLHRHKTGYLIEASVKTGGILSGGSEDEIKSLEKYAKCIGISFQITDDILDVQGDTKDTGKDVGTDATFQKCTYPGLLGIERSWEIATDLTRKAKGYLENCTGNTQPLSGIADYILNRKG